MLKLEFDWKFQGVFAIGHGRDEFMLNNEAAWTDLEDVSGGRKERLRRTKSDITASLTTRVDMIIRSTLSGRDGLRVRWGVDIKVGVGLRMDRRADRCNKLSERMRRGSKTGKSIHS